MPVDYASYLLSSSPPGFEFYTLRDGFVTSGGHRINQNAAARPNLQPFQINACFGGFDPSHIDSNTGDGDNCHRERNETSPAIVAASTPQSPTSPNVKIKKKVSFADDLGFSLTMVKIMSEPSSHPPRLRSDFISSLTQGAKASVATTTPPLVLKFNQPASNYIAFRENLERNSVSLENVILKDYNMIGTIKVKNVAFEKCVFVRVTFDSWESFTDISAGFVPSSGSGGVGSAYDTFSFEVNVPTKMDIKEKVQFAVGFEANNRQFWDNHNGQNYEVVSADYRDQMPSESTNGEDLGTTNDVTWSLYSNWENLESAVPYW